MGRSLPTFGLIRVNSIFWLWWWLFEGGSDLIIIVGFRVCASLSIQQKLQHLIQQPTSGWGESWETKLLLNCWSISWAADTHPISLYMKTQLIFHFTDLSNFSKYQIPYRWLTQMHLNGTIVFPNQLHTHKQIAESIQLRFSLLSLSTWFYMLSGSTPHSITPFWFDSDWLSIYLIHFYQ